MGTWSVGSFGNDSAGDWIIDLLETPTYQFIRTTLLASTTEAHDKLSNENAIAAAEVLCIVEGFKANDSDYDQVAHNLEPALEKLRYQVMPSDLRELAFATVEDIEKESELKELWEDDEEWISEIKALKQRLTTAGNQGQ